jgi:hypothetical protein
VIYLAFDRLSQRAARWRAARRTAQASLYPEEAQQ